MASIINDKSSTTFEDIIKEILTFNNVMFSVRSSGAVCEVNTEISLPLRISEQYVTIGDESRPWHIHVNLNETAEARFVTEHKSGGRNSYSIRFYDSKGNLTLRANFVKMYDSSNTLIQEKVNKYEELFLKHGKKDVLPLKVGKEIVNN
jgi:putative heme iron utilization protein